MAHSSALDHADAQHRPTRAPQETQNGAPSAATIQRLRASVTDPHSMYLTIVIPAWQEAKRLGPTLDRIRRYLEKQSWNGEVVVVVDGGNDGTLELARTRATQWTALHVLANNLNHGKGYSVRRGILEPRGQYVIFSDADLSTPIEEVEHLIDAIEAGADIAGGSRALAGSDIQVRQTWWRESMGHLFNLVVRVVAVPGVRDTQCGFKCFRRSVAQRIFRRQRINRFAFDVEIFWIARKLGLQVAEIPVTWRNDALSHVHPLRDAAQMFIDLIRLRLSDWHRNYKNPEQ